MHCCYRAGWLACGKQPIALGLQLHAGCLARRGSPSSQQLLVAKVYSYNCRKIFPPILKRPLTITGRPRRRGGRKSRTGPTSSTMQ